MRSPEGETTYLRPALPCVARNRTDKFGDIERFRNICITPARDHLGLVALQGKSGNRDDRDSARLLVSFEPTSGFQPGNVGQLNIEYNQVRRMTPGKLNRLFSKARSKNL